MATTTTEVATFPISISVHQSKPAASSVPASALSEISLEDSEHLATDPPPTAVTASKAWNSSVLLTFKTISTFIGLLVAGLNDAAYGAMIPSLQAHYSVSYTVVSLIFISPLVGYVSAAMLNNLVHARLGQRGVAFIGPGSHLLSFIIVSVHPPYPALVVGYVLAGFGNGILEAAWNAFAGNLANPNQVLGFMHGFYGLGATIAPLIASAMIARRGLPWWYFYYFMVGAASLELAFAVGSFWKETGARFRETSLNENQKGITRAALKERVTWVSAIYLMIYVGIEVALGGWLITFMIDVRNGGEFESGISATGFWLGITLGRVILGFVTPLVGENLAIILYMALAVVAQLMFWLIPSFVASAVAVAFIGFFLGPLFPAVVVAATKLLPKHLHVGTIGFAAAFGGSGACVLPFAVGAIAQRAGVAVLQPIILGMLVIATLIWAIGMPRIGDKSDQKSRVPNRVSNAIKLVRSHAFLVMRPKEK